MRVLLILALLVTACAQVPFTKTQDMMGTYVSITVYSDDIETAGVAIDEAFEEIKRVENVFSEHMEESKTSRANSGEMIVDPEFVGLVEKSIAYSELTKGAFDISIKPVLDLYRISFNLTKSEPSEEEIRQALEKVGSSRIDLSSGVSLPEGMGITFGGIAKGYAADKAIEVLKSKGVENALVNLGGDMRSIGKKSGGKSWRIALTNPDKKEEYLAMFDLDAMSVATSGNYERYFDPEKRFHHIVDPRTGYSAQGLISATVITRYAVDADVLSTAVFVLGKDKGMELIESISQAEAMIVTEEREIIKSSGWI